MKKYNFIFYALGLLFLMSSCSNGDNRHRDLINFLDSKSHHFTLDSATAADDAAIIELLTEVSQFNEYVKNSKRNETDKIDATTYLKNVIVFNQYLKKITEIERIDTTRIIDIDSAKKYHQNYVKARAEAAKISNVPNEIKMDKSEGILFTFPKLIWALQNTYNPTESNWIDTSWWQNKGFFVFLANYGIVGHNSAGTAGSDQWQTTAILQLATDVVPDGIDGEDSWRVVENQLYNFGDLKPPKIHISNPDYAPR